MQAAGELRTYPGRIVPIAEFLAARLDKIMMLYCVSESIEALKFSASVHSED